MKPQVTAAPDYDAMATRVIRGDFGNDPQRRQALGGAYTSVMAIVNRRLGGGTASTGANCGGVCVTVRAGDTLGSIAARNGDTWSQWTGYRSGNPGESLWIIYGTGWQAAAQRNGLRAPYTIYPGQRLI